MKRTTIMLPENLREKGLRKARRKGISLGELIRESLAKNLNTPDEFPLEDPLFSDNEVYKGRAPKDTSKSHDRYLYPTE